VDPTAPHLDDFDETADKIISEQPAAVLDEKFYGYLSATKPFGITSQSCCEVLDTGSKRWSRCT
jgi:hypothetical protein